MTDKDFLKTEVVPQLPWFLILTFLSVLLRGYYYRITFMLPYSYHYLNPTLFAKDIAFFKYDLNFFFIANAYLSKIISYETLFFVGYIISSFLFVIGIFYLTKTLFKNNAVAYSAVLLTIFAKPALSAMSTIWNYFYYRDLAMGFLLLALVLFLHKRYLWASLLLGIASWIHILFSLYITAFFGILGLLNYVKHKTERRKIIIGSVLLVLLLLPPVYLIFSSEQPTASPEEFQSWLHILKLRSFDHFFPSTWVTNSVIVFLPLFLLFLIFLYYIHTKTEQEFPPSKFKREITLLFGLITALGIIGIVFSEFIPIRMIIIAQLLRPTIFLTILALIFTGYLCINAYHQYKAKREIAPLLIGSALAVALIRYDSKLLLLIEPLLFWIILKPNITKIINNRVYFITKIILSLATIILLIGAIYSYFTPSFLLIPFYGEQLLLLQSLSYLLFPLLLFSILIITYMHDQKSSVLPWVIVICATILALTTFLYAVQDSTQHSDDPCYSSSTSFDLAEHFQYPTFPQTAFYNLSLWTKENLPADALVMIPVQCGDFRNVAQRSVFLDFKYGTMSTFSVNFAQQWFERVQDLNPQRTYQYPTFYTDLITDYRDLTPERVEYLTQKYNITHGVFEKPKKLPHQILYENERYVLYDVQNSE